MTECLFQHLTREEVAAFAASGNPVIVPLAATEQHGPHLPVYTDSFVCEYVVRQAAIRAYERQPLLVTPTLTIGCSDHHLRFNGTISFRSETYLLMLNDIAESLVTCGFQKIIFVNGHGGNERIMHQVASDIAVKHPVWTASASYWSVAANALREMNASEVGMVPGHAGGFEAAAILALRPELVKQERFSSDHPARDWIGGGLPGTFIGRHGELTGYDGYTDGAHLATAEKGRKYIEAIITALSEWLIQVTKTMSKGESSL